MPRNYDEYLYDSLCHTDEERDGQRPTGNNTRARRNSISEGLVPIPIVVEGSGVTVKMRVKPHVRWTKILSKWSAEFERDPPMAWPIMIHVPSDDSSFPCKSIQESISRTLGPELLERVLEKDPGLIVVVGEQNRRDPDLDVSPPVFPMPSSEAQCVEDVKMPEPEPKSADLCAVSDPPKSIPLDTKKTYKIRIESEVFKKPVKMSVSGGCSVSRLIRKYLEALKQTDTINPDIVSISYLGKPMEKLDNRLSDILGESTEGVVVEAFIGKVSATPKRRRRQSSSEGRSNSSKSRKIESEQSSELAYWEQVRSVRKDTSTPNDDDDEDDEDLALAIALSLSTETK